MIRQITLIFVTLFISFVSIAQQKIELSNKFSDLQLSGNLRVTLHNSDSVYKTVISVYGVDAQRVKWKSKGSILSLSLPSGIIETNGYADVDIYCPTIARLTIEGVSVMSTDTICGNNFTLTALSSINAVNILVSVDELTVNANGNSNVKIGGDARWATINATLGSRVDCATAKFIDCVAKAGQNAEVIVNVSEHLDAVATAKASVFYFGSPTLKIKTSLAGGVIPVVRPSVK